MSVRKSMKIRYIVHLRHLLRNWRTKSRKSASHRIPSDVPVGHVAVYVGCSHMRFIVRATYLNHPVFKELLLQAEKEYGFAMEGPLALPCDEGLFERVIGYISRSESGKGKAIGLLSFEEFSKREYCHVDALKRWNESQPLIQPRKTVW